MIQRCLVLLFAIIPAVLFVGCVDDDEKPEYTLRVHLTSGGASGGVTQPVVMPVSGIQYEIYRRAIFFEGDIVNVELARVDMGLGLLIEVSQFAARELYRTSVSQRGESLILFINDEPMGARPIDETMNNGQFFTFVEMSEDKLRELAPKLKESVIRMQKMKAKQ